MNVYRVSKTRYANDLSGEGARLFGGRWNNTGVGCVYTSENRALALLEYTVNIDKGEIPATLSITTIKIPDSKIQVLTEADLPTDWKMFPSPSSVKEFGSKLLLAADKPVIKVPSVIVAGECNFLLNPQHADSRLFEVLEIRPFIYDSRIKAF
jgi:RES domain-containing protein